MKHSASILSGADTLQNAGVRPFAITAILPASLTMRAAPSLVDMPPARARCQASVGLSSGVTAATSDTNSAPSSDGCMVKRPSTSDRRTSISASILVITRADNLSSLPKTRFTPSAWSGRSSSAVETVSFSLTMGMTPSCSSV